MRWLLVIPDVGDDPCITPLFKKQDTEESLFVVDFFAGDCAYGVVLWLFAFKGVGGVGIRRSGGGSVGGSFGG